MRRTAQACNRGRHAEKDKSESLSIRSPNEAKFPKTGVRVKFFKKVHSAPSFRPYFARYGTPPALAE